MNKKVLIFFPHELKQRHGGPYSMLYHLREGLKKIPAPIDFLSSVVKLPPEKDYQPVKTSFFKRSIIKIIPQKWLARRRVRQWLNEVNLPDKNILSQINIHQYDILHFHETIDIWRYRILLKDYQGEIILTSHSPKPYHLEQLEDVLKLKKEDIGETLFQHLKNIDVFAYTKANILVFPCKEATESYLDCWPEFNQLLQAKKVTYLTTGVTTSHGLQNKEQVRNQMNIPSTAFVITYVGRKLKVKGYDLLLAAAKRLLETHSDIYFIVVGKKDELKSWFHERFIETGWTDDPFSFVEAGDLHVVPNRYTNFDLNVLEVLSLGKPMLLSNTGGNKFFQQFSSAGLFFHEPNEEDLIQAILACFSIKEKLAQTGVENKKLYNDFFTAERFANDHVAFYQTI
jgi:glycosyltransferase involved in cell wall biosynthesis